ncbi:MAG: LPS export ABC transporter permease LptG [Syntrophorhabdaceae bacterium]|nr:LPS export ABC transporter permease LptG [Syntrophorhabdaceae bacterium]
MLGELTLKRLNRYLLTNVLKFLLITEIAGIVIFTTIEFFEHMDIFTSTFSNFLNSILYLFLRTPYYINLMLPLAFLISMLILLIIMIRNNEMITLRTSGISTFSIMMPFVGLSILLTLFSFSISEWIKPFSSQAAEYIYRVRIKKEEPYVFLKNDRIWFKRGNFINNIDNYDQKKDIIKGLTIIELSDDYAVKRRIDAEKGEWLNDSWIFYNVIERRFERENIVEKKTFKELKDLIRENPSIFKAIERNPEDMSYKELSRYIKRLRRDGHDVRRYLVDLYNKISFPFINLIMVFAAFSVGLRYVKTKHISKGILTGITVGILYWFFHHISLSFGYSDIFPPVFAAWLANVLFFFAGIVGIITLRT